MKRMRYLGTILAVALWAAAAGAETRVYFSPPMPGERPVAEYILPAVYGAQKEILVQQYQLTKTQIILALCEAKQRGVAVVAILDKSNRSTNKAGRGARMLRAVGIPVYFDPVSIAHNKVLIIDGCLVIGGSFNLTQNANERNLENCIFEDNMEIVGRFMTNLNRRLGKVGAVPPCW